MTYEKRLYHVTPVSRDRPEKLKGSFSVTVSPRLWDTSEQAQNEVVIEGVSDIFDNDGPYRFVVFTSPLYDSEEVRDRLIRKLDARIAELMCEL